MWKSTTTTRKNFDKIATWTNRARHNPKMYVAKLAKTTTLPAEEQRDMDTLPNNNIVGSLIVSANPSQHGHQTYQLQFMCNNNEYLTYYAHYE
jgi:hypothetical protein